MYLLFVDESGKPDERAFAVGGVAVRADEWGLLRDGWLAGMDAHAWTHDKEIKWHGTRTGVVPPALADELYAALANSPITCFVVIIKPLAAKQRRPDLFASPEDVYAQALMWLAERYQRFLARNDAYGAIVIDRWINVCDGSLRGCSVTVRPTHDSSGSSTRCCSGRRTTQSACRQPTWSWAARWPLNGRPVTPPGGTSSCYLSLLATRTPERWTGSAW
jgi:hypothetical protein